MNETLADPQMGMANWIFLGIAWTSVIGLLVWSFVRVLSSPPSDD
jgi:hypothetical protein